MAQRKISELPSVFEKTSVLRGRDLSRLGFSRVMVSQAVKLGIIERLNRGLYTSTNAPVTELHSYVQVAKMHPKVVFCLLTACRIHEITTQNPHEAWIALDSKNWKPKFALVKVRIVRFSGAAFAEGVEVHEAEGVELRVYSVAKTVADLFKYRNKFGLDIALEALRDALSQRKCTVDELNHFARICRVVNVMAPYLTAYLAQ